MSKLVLFDIDETLIHPCGVGGRALARAVQALYNVFPDLSKMNRSGRTDPDIFAELVTISGLNNRDIVDSSLSNQDYFEAIMPVYFDYLRQEIESAGQNYKLHVGVRELVDELRADHGICLGLLTGNVEQGARMKLAPFGMNEYFPIGAFGCDSASRLELPAVAQLRGKSYYNVDFKPDDIVIIGDSIHDVRCAKHYGAVSVAVTTGRTTKEELMLEGPDYLVDNLTSRSWFDSLNI